MELEPTLGDIIRNNKHTYIFVQCPICLSTRWALKQPHRIGVKYRCNPCNIKIQSRTHIPNSHRNPHK